MSPNSKTTSFLDDIFDDTLTWDKEDDEDYSSDSSFDDEDSSDEEDRNAADQQPAPLAAEDVRHQEAPQNVNERPGQRAAAQNAEEQLRDPQDEAQPALQPDNAAAVLSNLRSHPRSQEIIFRVARSMDEPLIRGDIDWDLLCSQLKTYPAKALGCYNERGSVLLQGILRMDPPAFVIQKVIAAFPKSCIDMRAFYAACQFGHEQNDEVVELVMHHTMEARRKEGIQWGMLAFLGDARVRTRHARILLKASPTALIDPDYGVHGVSPLDRMLSGAFIHGCDAEWVEKLKLSLLTAKFGSVDSAVARQNAGGRGWFPFHSLIGRLISKDFMGVRFGKFSFIRTLSACLRSGFSCQKVDRRGNLPIHVALGRECDTNLGTAGERKLIKFLLQAHPDAATTCDGNDILPLRLAIQNGWPCYDLIVDASPQALCTRNENGNLALHVVLSGNYHSRFGISGSRNVVKYFLRKHSEAARIPDGKGRLPLHLAMEHGWPCHDLIMAAAPRALETRDMTRRLYPFQIAACALQTKEEDDKEKSLRELSILFELIQYGPTALERSSGFGAKDTDNFCVEKSYVRNRTDGRSRKRKHATVAA